ncbi:2Fe-2S iron-sulfur cluster binding domain-containing protein [Ketobacter sp. MCCC 1A13808]|uniref:2Fe-2S iron-sulfur cluster-binding protein n=1 Tax=Ketobacter sp. MCCC 1A13808 TaxID=2602738 RepID=UPI000F0EF5B1|nr:2Fe-2S iron-sulfur cluster-binding protein [Ketobacter sp. MCCC 1A13808]MVF13541.1 2Fe-2S iron-sulfur cluster binding domain-containing protein [Ketobacter sp. MCCC 1A13808]RLP53352.1 MAG: ferredoxin [Ketobacter sp.]
MPQINVTTRSGEIEVVEAEVNQTLMEIIRDNGIEGMDAICGGCCSCATCHIYIDPKFNDQLPPVSEDEDMLLDGSLHRKPEVSRLSCQIRMSEALDGLALEIAPED